MLKGIENISNKAKASKLTYLRELPTQVKEEFKTPNKTRKDLPYIVL